MLSFHSIEFRFECADASKIARLDLNLSGQVLGALLLFTQGGAMKFFLLVGSGWRGGDPWLRIAA